MRKNHTASAAAFWNKEYADAAHLALSTRPSEDLIKFMRWLEREQPQATPDAHTTVLDIGCGNGRNLIYLSQTHAVRGGGFDISATAVAQAIESAGGLPIGFAVGTLNKSLPAPDDSYDIVLDMMASHALNQSEREGLRAEITRVLKPDGWLFMKTFLLDDDRNAKRMLKEYPADEPGSYIHPTIGTLEHVYRERELVSFLEPYFTIHRVVRSHQHLRRGQPFKRRSICIYAQKI